MLIVVVALSWCRPWARDDNPSGANGRRRTAPPTALSACTDLATAQRVATAALDSAMTNRDTRRTAGAECLGVSMVAMHTECDWSPTVAPSRVDLADEFLMGSVSHVVLMRHQTLNPSDRPLCPQEEAQLESLVNCFNRAVGPLLSEFRDLRTQEIVALIENGTLAPYPTAEASDEEVGRATAALTRLGVDPSGAKSLASASRKTLHAPPGNHVLHEGSYYPMPPVALLPCSQRSYDQVKSVVLEEMRAVVGWFVANGFGTETADLSRLYARIHERVIE